jgi:hypothetical protein
LVWAAWEPFERGAMLRRQDTNQAYVLLSDGIWEPITEPWNGETPAGRGQPPVGRVSPERGFGWVWSTRDDIFQEVGWATDREKGFCAAIQPFERGFLLRSANVPSCTPEGLYNFATEGGWQPLTLAIYKEGWRGSDIPSVSAPLPAQPTQTAPPTSNVTRPASQGRFVAPRLNVTVDGSFGEWPNNWSTLSAIVHGRERWVDAADLGARLQLTWNSDGLYLAVEVMDDAYRPGPDGSDMWQGDALEINFDGQLAADYASPEISADDIQIGLSFGPDFQPARGYRWLPFDRESTLTLPAVAVARQNGYSIEALIPWSAFDLPADAVQPGATFGFNLAVNDNDSDKHSQQTVIASSPARTNHDNPTQWGTLTLD